MRKIYLLLVVVLCVALTSCNNKNVKPVEATSDSTEVVTEDKGCCMTPEEKAEIEAVKTTLSNWATLDDNAKVEIIAKAKAIIEKRDADMKAKGEEMSKCMENLTEEQKAAFEAKKAEMEQKWADFTNLTLDEQKALIDERFECKCHKDGGCKDGNHEGCKGNHEGCQGNHEGCKNAETK